MLLQAKTRWQIDQLRPYADNVLIPMNQSSLPTGASLPFGKLGSEMTLAYCCASRDARNNYGLHG